MILLEIFNKILNESVNVNEITNSIKNRLQATINYEGDPEHGIAPGIRTIQAYVYGTTKSGNPAIRAYQPYGDTASSIPNWKLFRIDRIKSWKTTFYKTNEPAPKYNGNGDLGMTTILSQIDFSNNNGQSLDTTTNKTPKIVGKLDNINDINKQRQQEIDTRNKQNRQARTKRIIEPKPIDSNTISNQVVIPTNNDINNNPELNKIKNLNDRMNNLSRQ